MGRFVRKGEKGIAIMAPIIGRREAESDGTNARTVVGFRAAYVFDGLSRDSDPEYWSYPVETRAVAPSPMRGGGFSIRSRRTLRVPLPPKEFEQLRGRSTGPNRETALL
jgi:hypothetical protein